MHRRNVRVRVAVGAAVLAIAGSASVGQFTAVASTTPPTEPDSSEPAAESTTPASSEPDVSAPELDEDRETLVDLIVDVSDDQDVPLDWDCVAGVVAQVPDADIAVLASQIAESAEDTGDSEAAGDSEPAGDSEASDDSAADTAVAETTGTMESTPTLSPETMALGQQVLYCASGDADPELVAQVLTLIESSETAPDFDLVCAEAMLTTFEDETLELIIANGVEQVTDMSMGADASAASAAEATETSAAAPEASAAAPETAPEDALADAATLLACTTGIAMDTSADTTTGNEPAGTDMATETTGA